MRTKLRGLGTKQDPWVLATPPGTSGYEAYRDPEATPPALVVQVGKTQLRYHLRCIEDLHAMLLKAGEWVIVNGLQRARPGVTVEPRQAEMPTQIATSQ